jgi:hypothetical protein
VVKEALPVGGVQLSLAREWSMARTLKSPSSCYSTSNALSCPNICSYPQGVPCMEFSGLSPRSLFLDHRCRVHVSNVHISEAYP